MSNSMDDIHHFITLTLQRPEHLDALTYLAASYVAKAPVDEHPLLLGELAKGLGDDFANQTKAVLLAREARVLQEITGDTNPPVTPRLWRPEVVHDDKTVGDVKPPPFDYNIGLYDVPPTTVAAEDQDLAVQMRTQLQIRREAGLLAYARSLGATWMKDASDGEILERIDRTAVGLNQFGTLYVTHEDEVPDEFTERYMVLRRLDATRRNLNVSFVLLDGTPDVDETPMPVYMEVYSSVDQKPRALIFLLGDMGESIPMYDDVIKQLVDAGFAVAALDQRGHGLSGHPEGIEGLVDSPAYLLADADIAYTHLATSPSIVAGMPFFSLAISQGALLSTLISQRALGQLQGQVLINPVFWNKKQKLREVSPEGKPEGFVSLSRDQLIPQTFKGSSKASQRAAQWLDRGIVPQHIFKDLSILLWLHLNTALKTALSQVGKLPEPALVMFGEKDPVIGGEAVCGIVESLYEFGVTGMFEGRGHEVLLEHDETREILVGKAIDFLNGELEKLMKEARLSLAAQTILDLLDERIEEDGTEKSPKPDGEHVSTADRKPKRGDARPSPHKKDTSRVGLHVVRDSGGDVVAFPKRTDPKRKDDDPNNPKRFGTDLWGQVGDSLSEGVFVYAGGSAATVMLAEPASVLPKLELVPETISDIVANDNVEDTDSITDSNASAQEPMDTALKEGVRLEDAAPAILPSLAFSGVPTLGVPSIH